MTTARAYLALLETARHGGVDLLLATQKALEAGGRRHPPPPEVMEELAFLLQQSLSQYIEAKVKSLDEAFGTTRKKNFSLYAERKRAAHGLKVVSKVDDLRKKGWSTRNTSKQYAFEEAVKNLPVSPAWARDLYEKRSETLRPKKTAKRLGPSKKR